jgi:hypothetical protein
MTFHMRPSVVLALARADARRMAGRLALGIAPALLIPAASAVTSGSIPKALLLGSLVFVAYGVLFGPMQLVHDRRTGVIEYLARLPFSRGELAAARLVLFAMLAVTSAIGCGLTVQLALSLWEQSMNPSTMAGAASALAVCMFLMAGLAAPLFARLPPALAVGLPVLLVVVAAKLIGGPRLEAWGAAIRSAKLGADFPAFLLIGLAGLTIGAVLVMVMVALGRVLQPRPVEMGAARAHLTRVSSNEFGGTQ